MPHQPVTPKTLKNAAALRRRQTPVEAKLWAFLRAHRMQAVHFRRQHAIGVYVVDFCAPRQKLVIELDGGGHLDQVDYDARRSAFLESKGYRVLRIWNNDVINDIDAVMRAIDLALEDG